MKVALFIDGANLYHTAKVLGFDIDWRKLLKYFGDDQGDDIVRPYYFTALMEPTADGHDHLRPVLDWLEYNGYTLVTKMAKEYNSNGIRKIKGNMDIELCIRMLQLAPHVDLIYLFSGDGDFVTLVETVQNMGKRVHVVSSIESTPAMCSDELRRQADMFIELQEIQEQVGQKRGYQRPARG